MHTITASDRQYVEWIAARHSHPDDREDAIADGMVGLVQAAHRFDPEQGSSFRSFAYARIRGAMTDGKRAMDPLGRYARNRQDETGDELRRRAASRASLDEVMFTAEGECTLHDILAGDAPDPADVAQDNADAAHARRHLDAALDRLPSYQARVIRMRYLDGMTTEQVVEALDSTLNSVYTMTSAGLRALRHDLAPDALAA